MHPCFGASFVETSPDQYTQDEVVISAGERLYGRYCASCHLLEGESFGPQLGGITQVVSTQDLHDFIRNPASVMASGNPRASALMQRYKVMMPGFDQLKQQEIQAILAYIHLQSNKREIAALTLDAILNTGSHKRLLPPVVQSGIVVELEEFARLPTLENRPAYKGITSMRVDPRRKSAYFVNELMGILYSVRKGKHAVFLDLRPHFPKFMYEPGVASGLGSFAMHPNFKENGIFYTTHSEIRRGSPAINEDDIPADVPEHESPPLEWVLSEWTLKQPAAPHFEGSRREVLRFVTPTTAHGAQEIKFSPVRDPQHPDYGMLYIACGDGGAINLKRPDMAGHPHTLLGTIMRIDPAGTNGKGGSYGIPEDNPFANSEDPMVHKEIWAYGFRNPHRFSWDAKKYKPMIAIDIGESNIEEINIIKAGGNYGWGQGGLEGTMAIDPIKDPTQVSPASAEHLRQHLSPYGQYDHNDGTAITGGYIYRGPLKALQGKYIFGDIVNGRLFYMNMDAHQFAGVRDKTIYEIQIQQKGQLTSVREMSQVERAHLRLAYDAAKGELFILTKDDGRIRRIVSARYSEDAMSDSASENTAQAQIKGKEKEKAKTFGIHSETFGLNKAGEVVTQYSLTNKQGSQVNIIDYGATVVSLFVPDRKGNLADVVIGYDNMPDYEQRSHNFGSTIGRVAGRIANAQFELDGKRYKLPKNLGEHTLHGGPQGFDKVMWHVTEQSYTSEGATLTLRYESADGEMGFPGNLIAYVSYTFTEDNALKIQYSATSDKPTPYNPTHHSYFNLKGEGKGNIFDHSLQIFASKTPATLNVFPTGEIKNIEGSVLDFRRPTLIGKRILDPSLEARRGYNDFYIFDKVGDELAHVATLAEEKSGRKMEVWTTEPGLQLYTGNWLNDQLVGKSGVPYVQYGGVCLEAQHYPDSPNQPLFPDTILRPGEKFESTTVYKFSAR